MKKSTDVFPRIRTAFISTCSFYKKMRSYIFLLLLLFLLIIFTNILPSITDPMNPVTLTALKDLCVAVAAYIAYKIVRETIHSTQWNASVKKRFKIVFSIGIACIILVDPICLIIGAVTETRCVLSPFWQSMLSCINCVFLGALFSTMDVFQKEIQQ